MCVYYCKKGNILLCVDTARVLHSWGVLFGDVGKPPSCSCTLRLHHCGRGQGDIPHCDWFAALVSLRYLFVSDPKPGMLH